MKDKSIRLIIISQVAIIFSLLFLTLGFVPIVKKSETQKINGSKWKNT